MFGRWIFETASPEPDCRIAYGKRSFQFGELRLPKHHSPGDGPIPVVIVIHGGFWLGEFDLAHATHLCADLAEHGLATWCIEFRRLGNIGGGYPGTFLDVASAADHLSEIAPTYHLDLSRIQVLGHSAGGHLGLWLAGRNRLPAASPLLTSTPISVSKVVALAGISDLEMCWQKKLCHNVVEHFMGGAPQAVADRYETGSPRALLPLGVPQVLFHGDRDRLVPVDLSEDYGRAAQRAGDSASLRVLPGADHFDLIDPRSEAWPLVRAELLSLDSSSQVSANPTGV